MLAYAQLFSENVNLCDKKKSIAEKFHSHGISDKGVLISVCVSDRSGCHDFGSSLKAQFSNLDYIGVQVFCDETLPGDSRPEIFSRKIKDSDEWKYAVMVGCAPLCVAEIVNILEGEYKFTTLKHVYVVIPPHQSRGVINIGYLEVGEVLNSTFETVTSCSPEVSILTSGIDCTHSHSIGLPMPFPLVESEYKLPENFYGMIYIGELKFLALAEGARYLKAYFKQTAYCAKGCEKLPVTVLAIRVDDECRKLVDYAAKKYHITVNYTDGLPQPDYIKAIESITLKGGCISLDGIQSPIQAFYFGAKVLIHRVSNNEIFYDELTRAMPDDLQKVASVILGQSENYDMLNDRKKCNEVYARLKSLIRSSVKKFEQDKSVCASLVEEKSQAVLAAVTMFGPGFGEALKHEMKRITDLDWKYAKQKNTAFVIVDDESRRNEVSTYLSSMDIPVKVNKVKATGKRILTIDCSKIQISQLKEIDSMSELAPGACMQSDSALSCFLR